MDLAEDATCISLQDDDDVMGLRSPYRRRIRKSRGRGLRTRSGCLTCRKRHLKCDENKPTCGPCSRKDKTCEYSSSGRSLVSASEDRSAPSAPEPDAQGLATSEAHATSAAVPSPVSYDGHQNGNLDWTVSDVGGFAAPGLTEGLSERNLPQSPVTFPHSYLSPSNASFAAVRWFGLLASDAARETPHISTIPSSWANQCLSLDNSAQAHPTSLQHATQVLDSPANSSASHEPSDRGAIAEEQLWQSRKPIELLVSERALFEHFIHHVSPWIDLFDPTNQFSTIIPHLAINNAGLMNALLALAYRHLHLNPTLDTDGLSSQKELALQYYYQTLHYVQKAMQYSSYKTSLELLATTLIISAYEMLDNSTNDWERHLEGVFLIQRSQTLHGESGGLHAAVWWAWLCQDIWAAFREKRKTLTFFVPQKSLSSLLPHELASRSIYITAKVISYCAEQATEENFRTRIDDAMMLHNMLDDWRRHLTLEFSPLPLGPRNGDESYYEPIYIRPAPFAVAVQFFSVSYILLLSHEPSIGGFDQFLERQGIIKQCIEDICGIATTLKDASSSLMSSQALFVAGMFCNERQGRTAILALLELCRNRTGWPVKPLGDELKQLWKEQGKRINPMS